MENTSELTVSLVAEMQKEIGRKFEVIDLDDDLYRFAREYASGYHGDFSYMVEMSSQVRRSGVLTAGQARGVLNCAAAEGRRSAQREDRAAFAASNAVKFSVPRGKYVVDTMEYGEVELRVSRKMSGEWVVKAADSRSPYGWTTLATISNGVATPTRWCPNGMEEAVKILADRHEECGYSYAVKTGRCWMCGRELTDPLSIERGIGPECVKRL